MSEPERDVDRSTAVLAERLRRAVGAFVRAIRQDTDTDRSAQSEALDLLDRDGTTNIAGLAKARNVRHQTMQLAVAQLEAAGLVRCSPDPADRRSRLVALSEAGSVQVAAARQARASRIEDLVRTVLSDDEREVLSASIALLERMSGSGGS